MLHDFLITIYWWSIILILGLIAFPITRKLFLNFFDRGYIFSKAIAILFIAYLVWLLSTLHILKFSQFNLIFIIVILSLASIYFWRRFQISSIKKYYKIILAEELIFLVAFLVWTYIRAHRPDIHDLEKFMEIGFINSTLKSAYLPPLDMWQAGKEINYYYFGHFYLSFLTKLSGISPYVTYNLMISSMFAFSLAMGFSIGANLYYLIAKKLSPKAFGAGAISALILTLGSNLHTIYYALILPLLVKIKLVSATVTPYWYPEATRYIGYNPENNDKTIHEFPSYSFVVADFHAHVADILTVLLFIALALSFFYQRSQSLLTLKRKIIFYIALSLALGLMLMTNTWDYPIYFLVFILIMIFSYKPLETFHDVFLQTFSVAALSAIFVIPFFLKFSNISEGIAFVHSQSLLHQLFILWGYQTIFALAFFIVLYLLNRHRQKNLVSSDYFILILSLVSIFLIILPEIIYVKDIYENGYHRANTMFKFTYQAAIMFDFIVVYAYFRLPEFLPKRTAIAYQIIATLLIAAPLLYPFYSVNGYYGKLSSDEYKGLDGLQYLKTTYPDEYDIIRWLNQHSSGQPAIIEANGDSYSDYCVVSAMTGLPTVQGWLVHEWLWRGSYENAARRGEEVSQFYEGQDLSRTEETIKKYHVKYIIIGPLERQKYSAIQEDKIGKLGKVVYQVNNSKIIEVTQ